MSEQPLKRHKIFTGEQPEKKKALKKKAPVKPKPEMAKVSTAEPLPENEYKEFFEELRELTRKQRKRGGVHQAEGEGRPARGRGIDPAAGPHAARRPPRAAARIAR